MRVKAKPHADSPLWKAGIRPKKLASVQSSDDVCTKYTRGYRQGSMNLAADAERDVGSIAKQKTQQDIYRDFGLRLIVAPLSSSAAAQSIRAFSGSSAYGMTPFE